MLRLFINFSSHFSRSVHIPAISVQCIIITIHLSFSRGRVHTRNSRLTAGREERVLFKDRDREGFSVRATKGSLGGKVKEEGVVVVELVQYSALISCNETKSDRKRIEREREGWRDE